MNVVHRVALEPFTCEFKGRAVSFPTGTIVMVPMVRIGGGGRSDGSVLGQWVACGVLEVRSRRSLKVARTRARWAWRCTQQMHLRLPLCRGRPSTNFRATRARPDRLGASKPPSLAEPELDTYGPPHPNKRHLPGEVPEDPRFGLPAGVLDMRGALLPPRSRVPSAPSLCL